MNTSTGKGRDSFPTDWRMVPLGEVCDVVSGQVNPTLPEYRDLPHVNGQNIESGTGRLLDVNTAAEDGMTSGKYLFAPGDVLYSKLRPYLRKVALVDFQGVCSADMYPLRPHRDVMDPEFFTWLLLSDDFTKYADEESRRARMPKLNRDQLFGWHAPLPPLAEQKRIAGILKEQLAAVERTRSAAEAQLEAAKALPAAYLRSRFDTPEAETWDCRRIGDFAKTCSGATPSRSHPEYFDGDIPWVKTAELRDGEIFDTEEHVSKAAVAKTSLRLLPPNTLLIAMYGQGQTRGRTGRLMCEATTNQACFAILPNDSEFDTAYLQCWFRHNYHDLRSLTESRGGNQPNLNGIFLRKLEIPFAPFDTQRKIAAGVAEYDRRAATLVDVLKQQLKDIEAMPVALLRAAFQGQL